MMNLSLKVNDIKIEVSSELGVNSGLDIHLALQNDPTSSAANPGKIILEISRAQTNPSTSEDVVEEVFSEATDYPITESEHSDSQEEGHSEESDHLTLNLPESEPPEEEIHREATDSQITESEHSDSQEESHSEESDHFTLNLPESEPPEEEIHREATDSQITESEHSDSQEESHSEESDHLTLNLPESEPPEEEIHREATDSQITESEHSDSQEESHSEESDHLTLNLPESEPPEEEIHREATDSQITESEHSDSQEEGHSEESDHLTLNLPESEPPEEEIHREATDSQITESEHSDSHEESHSEESDHLTLNIPESEPPEEEIHREATDQLPQNAESHHQRVLSEEQILANIANLRLETGITLLHHLTSSCTGIQRFTDFCFMPWRDILNEIIEARLPLEIKNNLWTVLKELYRLAMKIDRLPENHQALLYRHLSPKFDRLFAWLCRLIENQSHQILNEVRRNILRIRRALRIFSLFIQIIART